MTTKNKTSDLGYSDQDLILREQLAEHGKSIRVTVFANIINAAILSFLFFDQAPKAMHLLWYGMFAYLSVRRLQLAERAKALDLPRGEMLKLKKHIIFNAAANAHMWGAGACLSSTGGNTCSTDASGNYRCW